MPNARCDLMSGAAAASAAAATSAWALPCSRQRVGVCINGGHIEEKISELKDLLSQLVGITAARVGQAMDRSPL
jgi:hypothetical protein